METAIMLLFSSGLFWAGYLATNDPKLFEFKWLFFIIALACLAYAFSINTLSSGNSYYTAINATTITNYTTKPDNSGQGLSQAFGLILIGFIILWIYKALRSMLEIE